MSMITVEFTAESRVWAEKLWDTLTDVDSWPDWQRTHFVKSSEAGRIDEGSNFAAELGDSRWGLTVTKAEKPERMVWTGRRLGLKAIYQWEFALM